MKTCKYLYGVDSASWSDAPYHTALAMKIGLAKKVVDRELSKKPSYRLDPFMFDLYSEDVIRWMSQDWQRINDCLDAIKHNKKLMEE